MKGTTVSAAIAFALVMPLSGCSNFREGFKRGFQQGYVRSLQPNSAFHESFRKSFKQNFLKSCEHGSTDSRWIAYCTCADSEVEKRFDDSGLTAIGTGGASSQQRAEFQRIVNACRVKTLRSN